MGIHAYYEKPASSSVDEKGVREYSRKFLVEMEHLYDAAPNTWALLPVARFDSYPGDIGATARTLDCEPSGDQIGVYEITIHYSSAPFDVGNSGGSGGTTDPDPSQTDQHTSPTDRPWLITTGAVHGTRILGPQDLDGVKVTNSAGQPFDPPIEIPTSNLTFTVTAYKDANTFDPVGKQLVYHESINNADFLLRMGPASTTFFPARSLRCNEYKSSKHKENGSYYYQLDITLEYKRAFWQPKVLDCGTCEIVSSILPPQPIVDATGNPITTPVPLDGSGNKLAAGGTPVFKTFKGYVETNFSTMLT